MNILERIKELNPPSNNKELSENKTIEETQTDRDNIITIVISIGLVAFLRKLKNFYVYHKGWILFYLIYMTTATSCVLMTEHMYGWDDDSVHINSEFLACFIFYVITVPLIFHSICVYIKYRKNKKNKK